jgi:hypothetical protein
MRLQVFPSAIRGFQHQLRVPHKAMGFFTALGQLVQLFALFDCQVDRSGRTSHHIFPVKSVKLSLLSDIFAARGTSETIF